MTRKFLDVTGLTTLWNKIKTADDNVASAASSALTTAINGVNSKISDINTKIGGGTVYAADRDGSGNIINTTYIKINQMGVAKGVATLDENGTVPSSQLPSYVDDVLEYNSFSVFPQPGETGKIYVDLSTNKTYRWSGTTYVVISDTIALGTTSSTAYPGSSGVALENRIDDLNDEIKEKADRNGSSSEDFSAARYYTTDEFTFTSSSSGHIYAGDSRDWFEYQYDNGVFKSYIYGNYIEVGETKSDVNVYGTSFKYNDSNVLTEASLEAISTATIEALS